MILRVKVVFYLQVVGSESLIGKPSENEMNLSSISLGSVGSEMNYFVVIVKA